LVNVMPSGRQVEQGWFVCAKVPAVNNNTIKTVLSLFIAMAGTIILKSKELIRL
jgi:hypothetical protein